ncbi:MAG: helix-turn-helix domain-containing protein [Vulcanimicrobiaceae bacterium]
MGKVDDIRLSFGQAVRRARVARKLSQEEFADECGLDRSYVGGVERGDRNPSLLAIARIAHGLDMPLSELFAECDPKKNLSHQLRSGRR